MRVKFGDITLRIGFAAAAVIVCMLNYGSPSLYICGFCSVLIHELTHMFFMVFFGCPAFRVTVLPGGVRIDAPYFERLTHVQAIVCLLGAPLFNLMLGVLLMICEPSHPDVYPSPSVINLTLGIINLIPLSFLDGGRALSHILLLRFSDVRFSNVLPAVNAVCLIFMVICGVVLSICKIYPVPYYLFVAYCIVSVASSSKNHVAFCRRT